MPQDCKCHGAIQVLETDYENSNIMVHDLINKFETVDELEARILAVTRYRVKCGIFSGWTNMWSEQQWKQTHKCNDAVLLTRQINLQLFNKF